MLSSNKGEIKTETIIMAVLAFAALIAFFGFTKIFADVADESGSLEACRISVFTKEKAVVGGTNLLNVKLKCPTQNVHVKGKKDSSIVNARNVEISKEDDVKEVIAGEMYNCWYKFGNGRVGFAEGWNFLNSESCFVCSKISFGDNVKNIVPGSEIKNFEQYLIDTKVPGRDISYYEYFVGNSDLAKEQTSINLKIDKA